jgi:hypothetical protein
LNQTRQGMKNAVFSRTWRGFPPENAEPGAATPQKALNFSKIAPA